MPATKKWHCNITKCCTRHEKWHCDITKYCPAMKSNTPTSPNTAPATQNDSHDWSCSHMERNLQWATGITLQPHQIVRLPRKMIFQNMKSIYSKRIKRHLQWRTVREWSGHDPSMNSLSRTRPFAKVTFSALETHFVVKITTFRAPAIYPNFTKCCACHEKWHSHITKCCACHEKWHSNITTYCARHEKWHCTWHEKWHHHHQVLRLPWKVTCQHHQILHLPRKMTLMIDPAHIWNVIYIEQQASPSNLTKQCACHAKWHSKIWRNSTQNG